MSRPCTSSLPIVEQLVKGPRVLHPRPNLARSTGQASDEAGAFAWTVYEMANRPRPWAVYKCCAHVFVLVGVSSVKGVGRDQVAEKAFGFSEVVARPRTGRRSSTRVACRPE